MTINDMMQKAFWDTDIPDYPAQAWKQGYQLGANAVLEEIEAVLNKGNEIRCDDFFTIAEIKRKIEKLKEE